MGGDEGASGMKLVRHVAGSRNWQDDEGERIVRRGEF